MQKEEVIIRAAKLKDINGILEVQSKLLLGVRTKKDAKKNGFLVYPVSYEELSDLINSRKDFLFVSEQKGEIVGYALAYDLNNWKSRKLNWTNSLEIDDDTVRRLSKEKVIYFRHIARKPDYSGVGLNLEEEIYCFARRKNYGLVIAEILEKPMINFISLGVHKKRGFNRIGQVKYSDGMVWGLYEKVLNK